MRRLVIACGCAVLLAGCTTYTRTSPPFTGPSPCSDSLYVALKERSLDSLSEREFRYLMERDRACMEYRKTDGDPEAALGEKDEGTITLVLAVIGAFAVVGLLVQ